MRRGSVGFRVIVVFFVSVYVFFRVRFSIVFRRVSIVGKCRLLVGCRISIGFSDIWGRYGGG